MVILNLFSLVIQQTRQYYVPLKWTYFFKRVRTTSTYYIETQNGHLWVKEIVKEDRAFYTQHDTARLEPEAWKEQEYLSQTTWK